MSTTTASEASSPAAPRSALVPRLGSLLAFAPLGVWVTWHLWQNISAWQGREAWESSVTAPTAPIVEFTTSLIVLAPLVIHAVWGIRRMFIMRSNLGRYPTFENLKYILQRLSAIGLLAFIPAHIWLARLHPLLATGGHETFTDISHEMRNHLPTLVVYLLGTLGAAYHLANGLATGGITWGLSASPRAMRRMNVVSVLFFMLLLGLGWGTVFALWNAGEVPATEQRSIHLDDRSHPVGVPVELPATDQRGIRAGAPAP